MSNKPPKPSGKKTGPKPNNAPKATPQQGPAKPNNAPKTNSQQSSSKPNNSPKANTQQGTSKPNNSPKANSAKPNHPPNFPHPNHSPKANPQQNFSKPNNAPKGNTQGTPHPNHPPKANPQQSSSKPTNAPKGNSQQGSSKPNPKQPRNPNQPNYNANNKKRNRSRRKNNDNHTFNQLVNVYAPTYNCDPLHELASHTISAIWNGIMESVTNSVDTLTLPEMLRSSSNVPGNQSIGPRVRQIRPPTDVMPITNQVVTLQDRKNFVVVGNDDDDYESEDSVSSDESPPQRVNINKSENMLKKVIQQLGCAICLEFLRPPIFICETGHNICHKCHDKLFIPICQVCNGMITDKRNVTLEEMCTELSASCPNLSHGCKFPTSPETIRDHLEDCGFRQFYCPFYRRANSKCTWTGNYNVLMEHFSESHPSNRTLNRSVTLHDFNVYMPNEDLQLLQYGRQLFVYHFKIDVSKDVAFWAIQFVGSESEAQKWQYGFIFRKPKNGKKMIEITEECRSDSVDVDEIFDSGTCIAIPLFVLGTYVQFNKTLNFKFYVKATKQYDDDNAAVVNTNDSNVDLL